MALSIIPLQDTDRIPEEEQLLRASEIQVQLGMSRAKIYRLMQENILPTVRIGGSVRVPRKALARWIEENIQPGKKMAS